MQTQALCSPNLNGTASSFLSETGSFFNKNDSRMNLVALRTSYSSKLAVSFSFDPITLSCLGCQNRHKIFAKGEGNGVDVFVLSDQNFPPIAAAESGNCLKIIRVENGTLMELANTLIDVASAASLGVGSLILLTSATMLADVGMAGYAEEFVRVSRTLLSCFGGKVLVRHVPPILLNGTNDSALIRSIYELSSWINNCIDKQ